jgi:hypothetical protein
VEQAPAHRALVSELDGLKCLFDYTYPRQYVAHRTATPPTLDGKLDDKMWAEVPWTEDAVDIVDALIPSLRTRAKMRFDDHFLYVGAEIQEPHVWANITHTCHCLNKTEDQVICHGSDYEVFTNPDGTNHNYKEFEMNPLNQTWDLLLSVPYSDGGHENSSRVLGPKGWDMQPPLRCATFVNGTVNDPTDVDVGWSTEIALPLAQLAFKNSVSVPPAEGDFWRIDFSRVEYHVKTVMQPAPHYEMDTSPHHSQPENWIWAPITYAVDMHEPDRWGMLEFTDQPAAAKTPPSRNLEWPAREAAMSFYYAQKNWSHSHNGTFTADVAAVASFVPPMFQGSHGFDGACGERSLSVSADGFYYNASFTQRGGFTATINEHRFLSVSKAKAKASTPQAGRE